MTVIWRLFFATSFCIPNFQRPRYVSTFKNWTLRVILVFLTMPMWGYFDPFSLLFRTFELLNCTYFTHIDGFQNLQRGPCRSVHTPVGNFCYINLFYIWQLLPWNTRCPCGVRCNKWWVVCQCQEVVTWNRAELRCGQPRSWYVSSVYLDYGSLWLLIWWSFSI